VLQQHGEGFPTWVLDQAGIDVMLANRVSMGRGLSSSRFRWVAFADALMLPLDSRDEAARTPDTRALYPLETKLLRRYLKDLGLDAIPATLDAYERDVVVTTLERQKAAGAVAIKFEAAYLRPLDFAQPDTAAARALYARYARGGVPPRAEYRRLEDYLFRVIAREAGRLRLAVQVHMLDGFGGFYDAGGSAPHLMESAFDDPALRETRFVIVHGGWPRTEETLAMLAKPNVYADISMMGLIAEPAAVARALRMWLAEWPEKVMFGTDAFDGGPAEGWDQVAWVGSRNARREIAGALAGMVRDAEISPQRAREIAMMVLRGNAIKVYGLADR
jgi:predicted TIM-barrel fold metal-dependent hydrolase